MAGGIFPRALALSGGPFAKKVTPGTTIPPAKHVIFRTGVIFLRRQARSQRRARDTPDGGERGGGGEGGCGENKKEF